MTIEEIFKEKGEAAFREMEAVVARELGKKKGVVIATGGGTMLNADNAAALGKNGCVFCLVATPEEIMERLTNDPDIRRPLLDGPNPMDRIIDLLKEREAGYARFRQLVTSGKSPEELTTLIVEIIQTESSQK